MNKKELFYFIGKCLMLDDHPENKDEIIDKIESGSIDWQRFITLCSNHFILPSIFLKFRRNDIIKYLPEELTEFLMEIYELNLSRNNQILEQLLEITQILNNHNIYPVFLKGAGNLLDGLYSDIGERILGDIDFMVSKKEYLLTAKLLEDEGYSITDTLYFDVEDMKHYPRLAKSVFPAILEIHQLPVSARFREWFNPEIIDQEKKTVKSMAGCYVLSDNHNIILNFIHSQLDHDGDLYGIVSFRDLYDLYLLSKRTTLNKTINNIKTKSKAIAYFVFADKAFGLNGAFYFGTDFSTWLFMKKHDLNLGSKYFYYIHRSIIYLFKKIFMGYFSRIIKLFYSQKERKLLIYRLSNRKWYDYHFQLYKNFFLRNK